MCSFSRKWVETHIKEILKAQPVNPIPLVLQEYNLKPTGIQAGKPQFRYERERVDMFRKVRERTTVRSGLPEPAGRCMVKATQPRDHVLVEAQVPLVVR